MSRIPELDSIRPELEKFVEGTAKQMGDSAMCLSLFTEDYKKGIDSMLQFSIAIMLDKPLFLLVKKGTVIPPKVQKIADGIEFFEDTPVDIDRAARKLLALAQSKGFCA